MKSGFAAFLCSWVCGAAIATAPAASDQATELASAMRLDAFFAQLTNQLAASANQKRVESPEPVPCLIPFTTEDFRDDAPRVLEKLFTEEEMSRALKFYRSADGQRFVELTFEFLDSRAAGRQPVFQLTSHEKASLKSFKRTRAGAILSSPLRIAGSNAAKQILREQYSAVASRCPQPDRA
jgi:hypothetical protein